MRILRVMLFGLTQRPYFLRSLLRRVQVPCPTTLWRLHRCLEACTTGLPNTLRHFLTGHAWGEA